MLKETAYVVLILLQAIDIASTTLILRRGGYEANGVMARLMGMVGSAWPFVKALLAVVAIGAVWAEPLAALVAIALYLCVAINNLRVLRHLRGS